MCFSAEASFGSGSVLAVIGVAAIMKCKARSQYFFASIPILLAIQQFSEGYLWLLFSGQGNLALEDDCTYVFLFFAQVLWPSWVPLSILMLEKSRKRKRIVNVILGFGILVSLFFGYRLISESVKAEEVGYHISYMIGTTNVFTKVIGVFYFLCTILPALISSINKMYLFGIFIALSYFFTSLFFEHYIISVWCFFAAITSIIVFFIIFNLGRTRSVELRSEIEF